MAEQTKQKLQLLRQMISCVYDLSSWAFDSHFTLVNFHSPEPELLHLFAFEHGQIGALIQCAQTKSPVVITNQLSMVWIADFEMDDYGKLGYVHLIGPAFVEDTSLQSIRNQLARLKLSPELRTDFVKAIDAIPVIPMTRFLEYGLMLHYCITDSKITVSDYTYINAPKEPACEETPARGMPVPYQTEQKMLKLIEEGNLEYKRYASQLSGSAVNRDLGAGDALRNMKNNVIIYTALCTRAAVRGGVDCEIAYDLSDRYIRSIEHCRNLTELAEVNSAMQEDFVRRVHACRHSDYSPQIQKCCGYIQLHLTEKISLAELAASVGYSESYLSKKFREETGQTIKEYIMHLRMEQAKLLLGSSSKAIADICEELGFGSQSYFGEQFRRLVGVTPNEYRTNIIRTVKE